MHVALEILFHDGVFIMQLRNDWSILYFLALSALSLTSYVD